MSDAVDWPPPGLESIHGRIGRLTKRAWLATLLLCPLVLWLLFDAPGLDPSREGARLLSVIALGGILAFLSAITGAAGVIDQMRRARRLGYPTDVILDAATDGSGNAAAFWSGTGAMADVRDITRTRARSLRRAAALVNAAAAVLPPPLLALALLLALRGAASLSAVLAIAFLPSVLALFTAALLRGYAQLLVQWDRGSAQWDPEPVTVADRARAWLARTQSVAPPRPPAAHLTLVLLAAVTGIAIFVFTSFTTAAMIAAGVGTRQVESMLVNFTIGGESPLLIRLARRERLPLDTTMDPRIAGQLLHYALFAGGRTNSLMNEVPPAIDRPWQNPPTGRMVASQRVWRAVLLDSSAADLLADSEHPAVDVALSIARARTADVLGGRYREDAQVPLFSIADREAGNAAGSLQLGITARAARAARAGRYDDAERDLRGLITLGLLLVDNSPNAADYTRGATMARQGHALLGRLRSLRGDSTTQQLLRELENAAVSQYRTPGQRSISGLRYVATGTTGAAPAHRWQAALTLAIVERCGSLRSVLFGPRPRAQHFEPLLHSALVRFPSEQRLFDVMHQPERHDELMPPLPLPRRWSGTRILGAVLGERYTRSICYATARM